MLEPQFDPAMLDSPEPEWQAEVRQRLERYRERRCRRGGGEQQQLEFQPPRHSSRPRRQLPHNVIPFQKSPVPPLADPVESLQPERMLDPCTTLFPVASIPAPNFETTGTAPLPLPLQAEPLLPPPASANETFLPEAPPQLAATLPGDLPTPTSCPEPLAEALPPEPV